MNIRLNDEYFLKKSKSEVDNELQIASRAESGWKWPKASEKWRKVAKSKQKKTILINIDFYYFLQILNSLLLLIGNSMQTVQIWIGFSIGLRISPEVFPISNTYHYLDRNMLSYDRKTYAFRFELLRIKKDVSF